MKRPCAHVPASRLRASCADAAPCRRPPPAGTHETPRRAACNRWRTDAQASKPASQPAARRREQGRFRASIQHIPMVHAVLDSTEPQARHEAVHSRVVLHADVIACLVAVVVELVAVHEQAAPALPRGGRHDLNAIQSRTNHLQEKNGGGGCSRKVSPAS